MLVAKSANKTRPNRSSKNLASVICGSQAKVELLGYEVLLWGKLAEVGEENVSTFL
ncbi:hypothetical protein NIES3974_26540 [Calothrix sp. NIES-3974]|nr:hypothetical protein NIES3974_26540 [Calothrix sp. NIES-3974]